MNSRGVILIEFAVCMPVLLILMFYIHDLIKIRRLYSQTEFVAQQMANILQNIAKTRAVTMDDITRAASLAYLTIYPGTTMHSTKSGSEWHALFHQPRCYIYFVKGESGGNASCVWGAWTRSATGTSPGTWGCGTFAINSDYSVIEWGTKVAPSSIYPTLKVEKYKVIIEAQLLYSTSCLGPNGEAVSSAREVFGLRLVNPKNHSIIHGAYFPSVVTFSPNGGFTETPPT